MSRPFGPQVKPFGPPARAASTKTDSFPSFSTLATRARMVSQNTIVPSGRAIGPSVPCNVTPGSPCPGTFAMTTSIFVPPLTTPGMSSAMVSVGGASGVLVWLCPWLNAAEDPRRDTAARMISVHLMDFALQWPQPIRPADIAVKVDCGCRSLTTVDARQSRRQLELVDAAVDPGFGSGEGWNLTGDPEHGRA